jgi:hypothetical protein
MTAPSHLSPFALAVPSFFSAVTFSLAAFCRHCFHTSQLTFTLRESSTHTFALTHLTHLRITPARSFTLSTLHIYTPFAAQLPIAMSGLDSDEDYVLKRKIRVLHSFDRHVEADRIQSEEASRTLKDEANAPSTAIARDYWFTVFQHFAANTLEIGERERYVLSPCLFDTDADCITARLERDDVIRFISLLPKHLQSKRSDGKVAWTVIVNAEKHLKRALVFNYRLSCVRSDAFLRSLTLVD